MRNLTLLFAMLFCFASYGQTNITNNLVSYLNFGDSWNYKTYGCCAGDSTNAEEQDETLCVEQVYIVDLALLGVDVLFIDKPVEMRNGTLRVDNGTVVFDDTAGGAFITYEFGNCTSNFIFNDSGRVFLSLQDYINAENALDIADIKHTVTSIGKLPKDMQFEVINVLGQTELKGDCNDYILEDFKARFEGFYILKITDTNLSVSIKQIF